MEENYERVVFDTRSETKISVMISESAFYVLRSDYYIFEDIEHNERKNAKEGDRLPGTFLAKICGKYYERSCADPKKYIGQRSKEIGEYLDKEKKKQYRKELSERFKDMIKESRRSIGQKFPTFQIAMSSAFAELLESIPEETVKCYRDISKKCAESVKIVPPGLFISVILEDYAKQTYCSRELTYFCEEVEIYRAAIRNNEAIRYRYYPNIQGGAGMEKVAYPIAIMEDEWSTHNYLLNVTASGEIFNDRISRIVRPTQKGTKDEIPKEKFKEYKKKALECVNEKGIMFARGNVNNNRRYPTERIRIRMTNEGHKLFGNMVYMRPRHKTRELKDADDGYCWEYIFECTLRQARNYFFKFGSSIRIEEPLKLRDMFEEDYIKSIAGYGIPEDELIKRIKKANKKR